MARKSPKNFEDALARLETVTENLQTPMISLDDALAQYQEGVQLIHFCQQKLSDIEQAILVLDNNELKELHLENK